MQGQHQQPKPRLANWTGGTRSSKRGGGLESKCKQSQKTMEHTRNDPKLIQVGIWECLSGGICLGCCKSKPGATVNSGSLPREAPLPPSMRLLFRTTRNVSFCTHPPPTNQREHDSHKLHSGQQQIKRFGRVSCHAGRQIATHVLTPRSPTCILCFMMPSIECKTRPSTCFA